MKQKICILGSTGSIGKTTLQILSKNKKNFEIVLLSGNNNVDLLISQAKKYKPIYIYYNNFNFKDKIQIFCKKNKINFIDDLNSLRKIKFDITVSAISGISGLIPTIDIIKFSKKILIANKESIICGWKFIRKELKKNNCIFSPIDSEHFSISKLIENKDMNLIKNIYLTASGGPFFSKKIVLKKVTILQAIKHPKWNMGKKISIDSANLMNKVLEVIEASLIFNLPINKFKIIIHPDSLVHSIVQFNNGLSTMLYHKNDMKIPIANSMGSFSYFKNHNNKFFKKLIFHQVHKKSFPSTKILSMNETLNETGYVLINSLNEILVDKFLNKQILFPDIVHKLLTILRSSNVRKYLKNHKIYHINDVFKIYNFCKSLLT